MQLFLDTANLDEIKRAVDLGVIDGVTTNPSLMAKEGVTIKERTREIAQVCKGPISAEVLATDTEGMIAEARELAAVAPNVVVKVPMTAAGLRATKALYAEDILINVTLVFSLNQALLAARAGATFISPFVGRVDDTGGDGMQVVEEIVTALAMYDLDAQVIAASIRHPHHVTDAIRVGADIATVPYQVLEKMIGHPLTDLGVERFLKDSKDLRL